MRLSTFLLAPAVVLTLGTFAIPSALRAQEGEDCGEIYCSGCEGYTYGHCFVEGRDENQPHGVLTAEEQEFVSTVHMVSQARASAGPARRHAVSFASLREPVALRLPSWANAIFAANLGDDPFHGDCRVCSWYGQPVSPVNCHPVCDPTEEDSDFATIEYQDLIDAADYGDMRAVVEASLKVPNAVQINEMRRSLQILNCQGTIIANLPLADLFSEMTERLDFARAEAENQQ